MPTKKKRVGFIPRDDVMKIIDILSKDNNLSNSKIINILVEEALIKRGLFDINSKVKKHNINYKTNLKHNSSHNLPNSKTTPLNETEFFNSMMRSDRNSYMNIGDDLFDLDTYQKFLMFLKFQEMLKRHEI